MRPVEMTMMMAAINDPSYPFTKGVWRTRHLAGCLTEMRIHRLWQSIGMRKRLAHVTGSTSCEARWGRRFRLPTLFGAASPVRVSTRTLPGGQRYRRRKKPQPRSRRPGAAHLTSENTGLLPKLRAKGPDISGKFEFPRTYEMLADGFFCGARRQTGVR